MAHPSPFATVVIPTYNQSQYLGQALDSLLTQTDSDWEAIVVNDGSTDRTAEIASEYSRRDSRIHCIHKANGGVASALNAGLENARGQWIHWLSSDDMFESKKLEINRRWIEKHPDHRFFFSYFTLLREATGARERRELWGPLPDPEHQILALLYRNYISGITICVRRDAWERAGFFDETLHYAQDYDQWLRLLLENQGVFIPEWTVISRNHVAQGSETFPDACYFDTAKAAVRFVNDHSFPELVPWADLSANESATKAVTCALDVACDRTAFLYCLGPHPALVLRLLEWAFSGRDKVDLPLKTLIRSRIDDMSLHEGDDDWAWMWRQLAIAVHGGSDRFPYSPIDIAEHSLREYRSRRIRGGSAHRPLREYLIRFEGIEVDLEFTAGIRGERIAFLVDRHVETSHLQVAAAKLARHGYRTVVVVADQTVEIPEWQWHGCVPIIRLAALDRDTLPWLGSVELAVTLQGTGAPTWLGCLSQLILADGLSASDVERNVMVSMGFGVEQSIRTVVFLERVLWGGGAERVVFDIVRHLDRRRYRPVIVTMVDEHTAGPKLPIDVEVLNVHRDPHPYPTDSGEFGASSCTGMCSARTPNRWVGRLRGIYHRLMSPEIRSRIGLGQRLSRLRDASNSVRIRELASASAGRRVVANGTAMSTVCDLDYIGAMMHHNAAAAGLVRIMDQIGKSAILISVMEEAAVTAWLAQAPRHFPYVTSLHTLESMCLKEIFPVAARLVVERKLLSASCNDAEVVTLPSDGCCRDLESHLLVPRARIRKIWNPVDCARVRRLSFQRIDAVERWRASANGFRMVTVGRLDPQKNHDLLLAACVELKKRGRDFSLSIVGEGRNRGVIEQRISTLGLTGCITLVGEQSNPFPWMAAANALVLTSRFEAFALVLVEAMVCGTPAISVNCPTGPAEVLNNGEFGVLVPNDDPVALAGAVERLMDDPSLAQRLSESGYERAREFDVKKIIPQWEELVDALPQGQG